MNRGSITPSVHTWLKENGYGQIVSSYPVGGGCINQGIRLDTRSKTSFFLKTNLSAPKDMFFREGEGLLALRIEDGPQVPLPYLIDERFILLEYLQSSPRKSQYWQIFGHQLANLHRVTSPHFGFTHDNYIGSTPQPNGWTEDGCQFFAEKRLLFQVNLAAQNGFADRQLVRQVEKLCTQLSQWIPDQPASLLHGDLWSGNVITGPQGEAAIIDPATHYGWAEAELAMTTLFGGFPDTFYQAYQEIRPLEAGYQQRFPIYNLYHLLNHVNLFGYGYLDQVRSIVRGF